MYTKAIYIFALLTLFQACQPDLPPTVLAIYRELPEKIDFNFHIRPILSDRCFSCHGPDEASRKGGLRLDVEKDAFAGLTESGNHAFVRGNTAKSEAMQRILTEDPELHMPPLESNLKLTDREKALIAKWIEEGAEWKDHWAFLTPQRPEPPNAFPGNWEVKNPIDNFILSKVKENGLSPSARANKERLIRRLSFDLRGLPPTIREIDQFIGDPSPNAYENLVDKMLSSSAHAERMAMEWMDVARFADSHGLHADGIRKMWPWRDWVIDAFRRNQPYDEFVVWQLAGDLLPNPTHEQQLATGFNRNHLMNSESGIVSEEYRLKNVADRANTTATAFLGLTMECAACHDHKFDPISQKEYYELTAFFNNVPELGMIGNDQNFGPLLMAPSSAEKRQLDQLNQEIQAIESEIELTIREVQEVKSYLASKTDKNVQSPAPAALYPFDTFSAGIIDNNPKSQVSGEPESVPGKIGKAIRIDNDFESINLAGPGNFECYEPFSAGVWVNTAKEGKFQSVIGNIGGKNTGWRGWNFYLDSLNRPAIKIVHALPQNQLHVVSKTSIAKNQWHQLFFTYDGSSKAEGLKIFIDGLAPEQEILANYLTESIAPITTRSYIPDPNRKVNLGRADNYLYTDTDDGSYAGALDQARMYNRFLTPLEVRSIYEEDAKVPIREEASSQDLLIHHLYRQDKKLPQLMSDLSGALAKRTHLLDTVQDVMVISEMEEPRNTFIQIRGQYDSPGEQVFANTPSAVLPFPDDLPRNRLGLGKWLFSESNPLTARVAINRYWQMIFGKGIVSTPHDFGYQGALPSHPELLDWLAMEFRESGWNLRHMIKLMVMSATYQQSSATTEKQMLVDANNTYLSVGASYRLQGEMIRDNALMASGILSEHIGGQSVKPYQPDGLWKEKNNFSGFLLEYKQDEGDALYRRSLYTFIRRTSPPPAMSVFDVPNRDVCIVKRENTSTPLQALVLLNDPQFVEASRIMAERMQKEGGQSLLEQTAFAFRLLCGRLPSEQEESLFAEQYAYSYNRYKENPDDAEKLLQVGEYPADPKLDKIQTAALAMVANTMMNFDEAYMKR